MSYPRSRKPSLRLPALVAVTLPLLLAFPSRSLCDETLIPANAIWRFLPGTMEASLPDTSAWRARAFNDSGWVESPAAFYYGEAGYSGTQLTGMQNTYTSIFLRRRFVTTDPGLIESLTLRAVCDDGFMAWINGVPVANLNAPSASPAYNALASANAAEPVASTPYLIANPGAFLQPGTNVLAVQVFNASAGSSDLVFDAALTALMRSEVPLQVVAVAPLPGIVYNLTNISVTFSEAVSGVKPTDLLLNGSGAASVSGSGATYTFSFAQPAYGTIQIGWDPQRAITTVAAPPRPLLTSTPDVTWAYELVDLNAPRIASLHPPAGRTVASLTEVEVRFDKAVTGVDSADLLINGQAAASVTGSGAGPFIFQFATPPPGTVTFSWTDATGIASDTVVPSAFEGGSWSCTLDPASAAGDVIINEFLAENFSGLKDEENDVEGWIELFNRGASPVDLAGWSMTDDPDSPGQWVFPALTLPARSYIVVFASGKDRRTVLSGRRLHTNFKLSPNGEYLALYNADAPRRRIDAFDPDYPPQGPDHSYGLNAGGQWRYHRFPTPGQANGESGITNRVEEVHFSVERGFFASPFQLTLHCATPGSTIHYTTNGSVPAATNGIVYSGPLTINGTRLIRAAAVRNNHLPSRTRTHSYLFNLPVNRRYLPALSIVTATNHLYGTTGIMEYNPRNTTKHGIAWERPVSVEFIRPGDNGGFQIDSGLRVAGGGYIRERYNYRASSPPENKYSFRLYFRGDYGAGRLDHPLFPGTTVESFDTIALRAGMNDPTNPFLRDELARQLASDIGQVASHGTWVNLFLNGVYKGYYNPTERIDGDFLETYHGVTNRWDLIASGNELREGDLVTWNALKNFANTRDLTLPDNYLEITRQLDVTNFVEYLLPLIYADTDDWPHNNWRAARPRIPGGRFRFYVWDAEWSFGYNNPPSHNTISGQLSSTSPPWGTTDIQRLFNSLKRSPEFKLLFADRVHRHLFNGGALTDARIRERHEQLRIALAGTISGFNNTIASSWIPARRAYLLNHLYQAGFLASSNAPVFNLPGGRVPAGSTLTMTCINGTIHYTTDGSDPRMPFTGAVAPGALTYASPLAIDTSLYVRARTREGTNWSAVSEATISVEDLGIPLRITEIMYHPPGGSALEFIEIRNLGAHPVSLQDFSLLGVDFRFPIGAPSLAPGAAVVVASDDDPTAFAARYPELAVAGYFGGSLDNSGETIALLDPAGRIVCSVDYGDAGAWPAEADGSGSSLEAIDPRADLNDPANWQPSALAGGSPGLPNVPAATPEVRLNEVATLQQTAAGATLPDWVELHHAGSSEVSIAGWTLSDSAASRNFRFPDGTRLTGGAYLLVWFDSNTNAPGLHTGFALDSRGEDLLLSDATGQRMDVLRFGPQVANYTIGRTGAFATWGLTEPTPGSINEPALLATASHLTINEVMANPPAGEDDWIEIHNRDSLRPAPLRGAYLATTNTVHRILSLSFVAPGGFVRLWADEQGGPDHLSFRLPASGTTLVLSDSTGAEIERLTYPPQSATASFGRLPDGSSSLQGFPGSASPGASNYLFVPAGPWLNEVLARNTTSTNLDGRIADWIELHNPTASAIDLGGVGLAWDDSGGADWMVPAGVSLPAGGYLTVWCDGGRAASTNATAVLYSGHSLPGEGGVLRLLAPTGQTIDRLVFGFQVQNRSVGRIAGTWQLLETPTPGGPNAAAAPLGSPLSLRLNEWMADARQEADWFELFNPEPLPVAAGGLYLTDDPSLTGQTKHPIPPLTFVPPGGYLLWLADAEPENGPDHVNFSLNAQGETLRLNLHSNTVIDAVDFTRQYPGVSEGRWPDGATSLFRFPRSASPGESNYLPLDGLVINEILSHTDPPLQDTIEIQNRLPYPVDLSHWFLSDDAHAPAKYRFPNPTILAPGAFLVVDERNFNTGAGGTSDFALNSAQGGRVLLSVATPDGRLTGWRTEAAFGAAANAVSFGRYETSLGADLTAVATLTLGQTNSAPVIGPVVLTEIHYAPPTDSTNHSPEEFIELFNSSGTVVSLYDPARPGNTWQLRGDVDFAFPPGQELASRGHLLLVDFDPLTELERLAAFRSHHNLPATAKILGPYSGRLNNSGGRLELVRPDTPQGPGPDEGFVPQLRVDYVDYTATEAWPGPAVDGRSLQRLGASLYGNEPLNWTAASPTPGTTPADPSDLDSDGDGMPDQWEIAHGFARLFPGDAALDPDGDSRSNWEEYVAGTDPHDPTSYLALEIIPAGTEFVLRFTAEPGKSYRLESATDLSDSQWQPLTDIPAQVTRGPLDFYLPFESFLTHRYFRVATPARF